MHSQSIHSPVTLVVLSESIHSLVTLMVLVSESIHSPVILVVLSESIHSPVILVPLVSESIHSPVTLVVLVSESIHSYMSHSWSLFGVSGCVIVLCQRVVSYVCMCHCVVWVDFFLNLSGGCFVSCVSLWRVYVLHRLCGCVVDLLCRVYGGRIWIWCVVCMDVPYGCDVWYVWM